MEVDLISGPGFGSIPLDFNQANIFVSILSLTLRKALSFSFSLPLNTAGSGKGQNSLVPMLG